MTSVIIGSSRDRRTYFSAFRAKAVGGLPPLIVAAVAYFWWLVFYPGLLSNDSIVQYTQAATGRYTTIRPPIMSIILHAVLHVGGDIQHLMLAQCLAALFGVYFLALRAVQWWMPRLPKALARWGSLLTIFILTRPVSPLVFNLMTFWTDIWIMTCCCWLGALWFDMTMRKTESLTAPYLLKLILFVSLSVLMVLVRHNSIVLLPLVSVLFMVLVRRFASWKWALPALLLPFLLYRGVNLSIRSYFHVEEVPLYRMVLAHEMVGLCARHPEFRENLTWMSQNLTEDYRELYYGGYCNLYGATFKNYLWVAPPEELHGEYRKALLTYPLESARVKFEHFRYHFRKNPCFEFQCLLDPNEFGLVSSNEFQQLKDQRTHVLYMTFKCNSEGWFFCRHIVWLSANIAALAALVVIAARRRSRRALIGAAILLLPLGYYLSFLLASLSAEFRYMYPSSLFLQTTTISCIVGSLFAAIRSWPSDRSAAIEPIS